MRRIDDRNPTATFEMYSIDPKSTALAAKRMMAELFPPKAERNTEFTSISYAEVKILQEIARLGSAPSQGALSQLTEVVKRNAK